MAQLHKDMGHAILLTCFLLSLSGCLASIPVKANTNDKDELIFSFEKSSLFTSQAITMLQVGRRNAPDKPAELVWVIESADGRPQPVQTISYGVVPPGFIEIVPPAHLQNGDQLDTLVSRPGATGGVWHSVGPMKKKRACLQCPIHFGGSKAYYEFATPCLRAPA